MLHHEQFKNLKDALLDYNTVTDLDPMNEMAYLNRARLYAFELNKIVEAVKECDKVLAFNPNSMLAKQNREDYLHMLQIK